MTQLRKMPWKEIEDFVNKQSPETKFYIGTDSRRFATRRNGRTVFMADYAVILAVHIDGCRGCKLFGQVDREPDYDQREDRPAMRLMNEVYKLQPVYDRLHKMFPERKIEIHLDLNPDEKHGSNCVTNQAIGFIKGTCNVTPFVKPLAMAASFGADKVAGGGL